MIDTDKYEGHTPAPWVALNDNAVKTPKHDDPYAFIERRNDDGYVVALSKADAQLIADAPLLLAEVKRLRKQVQSAHEWVMDYFAHDMGGSDYGDWIDYMTYKGNGGLRDD